MELQEIIRKGTPIRCESSEDYDEDVPAWDEDEGWDEDSDESWDQEDEPA